MINCGQKTWLSLIFIALSHMSFVYNFVLNKMDCHYPSLWKMLYCCVLLYALNNGSNMLLQI